MDADHAQAGTKSLGRGLALLRLVAAAGPAGLKVSEIANRAGLHVATVHRQLSALVREGFVAQDSVSRHYTAGPELLSMAFHAQHRYGLENRILPIIERVAEATGDVVYANARAGDEAVCLAMRQGSFPIRALPIEPGTRRPLGIGAGSLAILAFLPPDEADEIMARNAEAYLSFGQTRATVGAFVARARADGFTLNDAQITPGITAVALPVPSASGRPFTAISVAAIQSRMSRARQFEIVEILRAELRRVPHPPRP